MRVEFTTSTREVADLLLRTRSRVYHVVHWVVAVAAGLAAAAALARRAEGSALVLGGAAVLGLVTAWGFHLGSRMLNRWQMERAVRASAGGREFHVVVEVTAEGVLFQQLGIDVLVRWPDVARAEVTGEGVGVWRGKRLQGMVRSRAFDSDAAMEAFARAVNEKARTA